MAASPIPYTDNNQTPKEMDRMDMDHVIRDFVVAANRADEAGFDMLELHCAHGYLLNTFLSPKTNHRKDNYGGNSENRLRFPLEVFAALRAAWPSEKPICVRISATDWIDDGFVPEDAVEVAKAFKALPTLSAASPEIPESISSKISVETGSLFFNTDFIANIIRDTSPPDATFVRGFGISPGFALRKNST